MCPANGALHNSGPPLHKPTDELVEVPIVWPSSRKSPREVLTAGSARRGLRNYASHFHVLFHLCRLFTEMVMAIETRDLVVKKMVYLYLCNYAHDKPDLAIMYALPLTHPASRWLQPSSTPHFHAPRSPSPGVSTRCSATALATTPWCVAWPCARCAPSACPPWSSTSPSHSAGAHPPIRMFTRCLLQ